jgi:hydrogenase expression/formation protein HypD
MLIRQRNEGRSVVEIQYSRAVKPEGNPQAKAVMERVFREREDVWRGLGTIPGSGLGLCDRYAESDAEHLVPRVDWAEDTNSACICGEVLRGVAVPTQCPLFATTCTPERPRGACMVSREGTCATYYRYGRTS